MLAVGTRIQIPVHYDLWMKGARFGEVVSVRKDGTLVVKVDHPQVRGFFFVRKDHQ